MAVCVCAPGEEDRNDSQSGQEGLPPAEAAGAQPAGASTAGSAGGQSMAMSVTRHALISNEGTEGGPGWRFLLCGVDSLDLGLYVNWGTAWPDLWEKLEAQKKAAYGTEGVIWRRLGSNQAVFFAGGMGKQYRYHFQVGTIHIFMSSSREPRRSPNVYASISAWSLWYHGIDYSVETVCEAVRELLGQVVNIQVSRCDLCADFLIPGGLSEAFIDEHLVSRARKDSCYRNGGVLETYYLGGKGSPTQLRVYDKSKEVLAKGEKLWFLDHWGLTECRDVWRVEFQLRRTSLRELGINGPDSLLAKMAGLWAYLTSEWVSLRLLDDVNASRRSIHPWWKAVQECAARLGELRAVSRVPAKFSPPDLRRAISMVAGYFVAFAARVQGMPFLMLWELLGQEVLAKFPTDVLLERIRLYRAKAGLPALDSEPGDEAETPF